MDNLCGFIGCSGPAIIKNTFVNKMYRQAGRCVETVIKVTVLDQMYMHVTMYLIDTVICNCTHGYVIHKISLIVCLFNCSWHPMLYVIYFTFPCHLFSVGYFQGRGLIPPPFQWRSATTVLVWLPLHHSQSFIIPSPVSIPPFSNATAMAAWCFYRLL